MIKAFLFDMDGTLCDSERYYTDGTYTWLSRFVKINKNDIYHIVGLSMDDTYKYLANISGLDINFIKQENEHYFNVENVINYKDYLFSDVRDVLFYLKENNYKLALCTVSDKYLLDKFIKDCGLESVFDILLSNDDINSPKPDPEIYLNAMKKLNVKNNEAIIVEDSYNGILSGKRANCLIYARNSGQYGIDQSKADFIFNDLREILDRL